MNLFVVVFAIFVSTFTTYLVTGSVITNRDGESTMQYSYKTENGQYRMERLKYNSTNTPSERENEVVQPVEYRGGFSFISDDGYEYMVLYKANKNGFQPYVTAHKIGQKEDKKKEVK